MGCHSDRSALRNSDWQALPGSVVRNSVERFLSGLVAPDVHDLPVRTGQHLPSILLLVRHQRRGIPHSQVNNEPIGVDGNIENASAAPLRLAALVPVDHIVTGPTWWLRVVRRSPANVGSKQVREPIEVGTVESRANSRCQVLHVGHRRLCHSDILPPVSCKEDVVSGPWGFMRLGGG